MVYSKILFSDVLDYIQIQEIVFPLWCRQPWNSLSAILYNQQKLLLSFTKSKIMVKTSQFERKNKNKNKKELSVFDSILKSRLIFCLFLMGVCFMFL
ncbi:uncharacterized protein ASCRUDRAFT_106133 [Ascoidea rubescens DSM 1968]|uniref:Uncharacterized protein n=1 Tax=Ascoidea rubescens DSM 1968 TaxID=1344418 RepID=A0A1D2VSF3_9ASCO|nr:hypothetical protein ASCRUDRAFT_106133 [Ascoidea rubescens DSM 1968]ODV64543.1 hypothetical protein ASCRUDRAFT_106133 [Ascoidea rubescens DSM 1968]